MTGSDDSTTHESTPAERAPRPPRTGFFGVVAHRQSWLNLVYLALAFPLGLFYFVFLVVCLSVGIGLVIVWVGLFVLALTAAGWWAFASFERSLADNLLGTKLGPSPRPWRAVEGTLPRLKAHFSAATTWKDLAFLFVKFPLGVLSFVVVVSLGAASLSLIGAPLYYRSIHGTSVHSGLVLGAWQVDRLWQALLLVPLGILLFFVSFHAFNGLAAMWRAVATGLLEHDAPPQDTPAPAPGAGAPAVATWPAAPTGGAGDAAQTSDAAPPAATQWPPWQPSPYDWPPPAHQPSPYDWPPLAPAPAWPAPYPGQAAHPGPPYPGQAPAPGQQPPQQWPAQAWQGDPWAGQWPQWPAGYEPPAQPPAAAPEDLAGGATPQESPQDDRAGGATPQESPQDDRAGGATPQESPQDDRAGAPDEKPDAPSSSASEEDPS